MEATMEKHTNSWFVQSSGQKELLDTGTIYSYCNRSRHFRSKSTGQRHVKTQGSSKINAHCTAFLIVAIDKENKHIKVQANVTHYGHRTSPDHLRIPEGDSLAIAG